MPRKKLPLQSEFPYALTARSNNRDWFSIPLEQCWRIFEEVIALTAERYKLQTHCFVLMANHFHWLVSTPDENLGLAMRFMMTETSRRVARSAGRINKIYGARYKPTLIADPVYYANTIRYFYQNPLRAGICSHVDTYPWTTRSCRSRIEVTDCGRLSTLVPSDAAILTTWLNSIPEGPYQEVMRLALRRHEFEFPPHPTTKRPMSELSFL